MNDPYLNKYATYGALIDNSAAVNAKYHAWLRNDANSGRRLFLLGLKVINLQSAAVTGVVARFDLLRTTGNPTGGANGQIFQYDSLTPAITTGTTFLTAPTGFTDGQILQPMIKSTDEHLATAANVAELTNMIDYLKPPHEFARPIVLNPGEAVAVKQVTNTAVGLFAFEFVLGASQN